MWEGALVGSPFHTPQLYITNAAVSLLVRQFSLGTCARPSSWLAKMCHIGSDSACFELCWVHILTTWVTPEPKSWEACWWEAEPARQQVTNYITETQRTNQHILWSMWWWKVQSWVWHDRHDSHSIGAPVNTMQWPNLMQYIYMPIQKLATRTITKEWSHTCLTNF